MKKSYNFNVEKNLTSLLSLLKWQSKVVLAKHNDEFNSDSPFLKIYRTVHKDIKLLARLPQDSEEVAYSNGMKGVYNDSYYKEIIRLYLHDDLTQYKVIELLRNWHDIELHEKYIGSDFVKSYFPIETKDKDKGFEFKNEIQIGEEVAKIFIDRKNGEKVEVLCDTEQIYPIMERYSSLFIFPSGYVAGRLRKEKGRSKTQTVARFVIGAKGNDVVRYKNGNKSDIRKKNLQLELGSRKYKSKIIEHNGTKFYVPIVSK